MLLIPATLVLALLAHLGTTQNCILERPSKMQAFNTWYCVNVTSADSTAWIPPPKNNTKAMHWYKTIARFIYKKGLASDCLSGQLLKQGKEGIRASWYTDTNYSTEFQEGTHITPITNFTDYKQTHQPPCKNTGLVLEEVEEAVETCASVFHKAHAIAGCCSSAYRLDNSAPGWYWGFKLKMTRRPHQFDSNELQCQPLVPGDGL